MGQGRPQVEREVVGALRSCIAAHGPITPNGIGSAAKRITSALVHAYPYRWAWKGHGTQRQRTDIQRQGQLCRVVARGRMNSVLLEFQDGFRTVTSANGIRRI